MYKVLGSDQQVYGPVTSAQLRQWMVEGRVHAATQVQSEGATDWKPLSSLPEFAAPPVVNMPPPVSRTDNNQMGQASLICGILANLCCCGSTVFAVIGIVLSIIVLARRQDYPGESSRPWAVAGLILCVIGLLWHCLWPLAFVLPNAWGFRHFHWR